MYNHQDLQIFFTKVKTNMTNFKLLEVVGRGSETTSSG